MSEPHAPATTVEADASAGIRVRRVRPDEYAATDALVWEAYDTDYGPSQHARDEMQYAAVRDRAYDVWVAVDGAGELVGSVTTRRSGGDLLHEDFAPDELDLRLLAVSVRARRRGVAATIMRHVIEVGRLEGWSAVVLKTAPHMTGPQALYESLGFERATENDGLWIGGVRQFDLYAYRYRYAAPAAPLAVC